MRLNFHAKVILYRSANLLLTCLDSHLPSCREVVRLQSRITISMHENYRSITNLKLHN